MFRLSYLLPILLIISCGSGGGGSDGKPRLGALGPVSNIQIDGAQLFYQGAFRLPAQNYGVSDMTYAENSHIAYNSDNNSIFVVGHLYQQAIAEFAVPPLSTSTVISDLAMASAPIQSFSQVLGRPNSGNPQSMDRIGGMLHLDGELIVNAYEFYDAQEDATHTTLKVDNAQNLAGSNVSGYFSLGGVVHAGGWMSPIPAEWQSSLGGAWIAGNSSGEPIITRLSVGPSAFVFDPADLGLQNPVPTTALLDFNMANPLHNDLLNNSLNNDLWTHMSRAVYGFIPPGTATYVTIGYSGGHASGVCYKCTPVGQSSDCGGFCAKDSNDYQLMYWLWDVNDLVKVKNGQLQPHDVLPYGYGPMVAPFPATEFGGGSYDPGTGQLFLTLSYADTIQGPWGGPPIVLVYSMN